MDTNNLIEKLGGTVALARALNVRPQAVSQWKKKGIPDARMQTIRLLHPEFFDESKTDTTEAA